MAEIESKSSVHNYNLKEQNRNEIACQNVLLLKKANDTSKYLHAVVLLFEEKNKL